MNRRYEIRDAYNPTARGMRFSNFENAWKELSHAVPAGRWYIWDRQDKVKVS